MPYLKDKIISGEEISDPGKIQELLQIADEKSREESAGPPQTTLEQTDQGTKVTKHLSGQSIMQVKGLPNIEDVRKLAEEKNIPWKDEYVSRLMPYWASDERVDRHGDIVRQNWTFDEFSKNTIMLYSHSWDLPPIGAVLDWSIGQRKDSDYTGRALYLLTLFATKEQWDWADTIFRLVSGGFLKSGSVGFYPGTIIDVKDDKEREQLGLGRWGYILDNNSLIEWSPTSVPANVGAHTILNSMKQKNLLQYNDAVVIRELERMEIVRGKGDLKTWKEVDSKLKTIWKDIFGKDLPDHEELDVPFIEYKAATTTAPPVVEESIEIEDVYILENVKTTLEELSKVSGSLQNGLDILINKFELFKNEFETFSEDVSNSLETIMDAKSNEEKGEIKEETKKDTKVLSEILSKINRLNETLRKE